MKIGKILSVVGLVGVGALGAAGVMSLPMGTAATTHNADARPVSYLDAAPKNYEIDPVHSGAVFKITHAGASPFYGLFTGVTGSLSIDAQNPGASTLEVSIDTNKIMTGNNSRDDHLRSGDFFNVRQFPTSTFKSKAIKAGPDGAMHVEGELTLLGKALPVTATLTPTGQGAFRNTQRGGFEASLSFKRSDFGMTMYVQEGVLSDQVDLTVFIQGVEQ